MSGDLPEGCESTEVKKKTDQGPVFSVYPSPMASADNRGDLDRSRLAVMASGRGTDFQALIDAKERGELSMEIALLVCNVPGAMVLERARRYNIPTFVLDHRRMTRKEFDERVHKVLLEHSIDLIALAGFMRILSDEFVGKWRDRIVNIHPALLPSFPGAHAHKEALDYGVKVTGLTIHFVDEEVDHGPIIFQHPVEVNDDDNEDTLSARVLAEEHIWYPKVLQWIAEGRVHREGRRVFLSRDEP